METHYKNQGGKVIAIDAKTGKKKVFGEFHKGDKKEQAKNFSKNLNIMTKMELSEKAQKERDKSRECMKHMGEFNIDGATKEKYNI